MTLKIEDLEQDRELDRKALSEIRGGSGLQVRMREPNRSYFRALKAQAILPQFDPDLIGKMKGYEDSSSSGFRRAYRKSRRMGSERRRLES